MFPSRQSSDQIIISAQRHCVLRKPLVALRYQKAEYHSQFSISARGLQRNNVKRARVVLPPCHVPGRYPRFLVPSFAVGFLFTSSHRFCCLYHGVSEVRSPSFGFCRRLTTMCQLTSQTCPHLKQLPHPTHCPCYRCTSSGLDLRGTSKCRVNKGCLLKHISDLTSFQKIRSTRLPASFPLDCQP